LFHLLAAGGFSPFAFSGTSAGTLSVSATVLPSCRITSIASTTREDAPTAQKNISPGAESHCNFSTKAAAPTTRLVGAAQVLGTASADRIPATESFKLATHSPHLQYTFDY